MNLVILAGRLTRDPEVRYTNDNRAVARYTLAVDRTKKGEADFISCIAWEKQAEFAERFLKKGAKILVEGRIQTGSYTNREGQKVNTVDVIVNRHEFCESKVQAEPPKDEFVKVPDNVDDEGLPFN